MLQPLGGAGGNFAIQREARAESPDSSPLGASAPVKAHTDGGEEGIRTLDTALDRITV